ncbi:linear amide C-N hydrolase [Kaistia granuli]|uniref:linear amide C-N hydrolase n=1 Tax=Kaistia granuli TaxID=363259 RepID=UPI00035EE0BF|nr:linear amide C-N hydrolase [Kaistia granuli]
MCTALIYQDANGKPYLGRTLELTLDLPYQVVYLPAGFPVRSEIEGHPALEYKTAHALLSITMPVRIPTAAAPMQIADLKVLEGLNDKGLTFSLLSYPAAAGHQSLEATRAVLSASDLGSWILGSFATAAEVKAALAAQPVSLVPLAVLGGVESPFHYIVNDASGGSIVIEFNRGAMTVYDNPVRVMTNGPEFPWHLTNLANYSFLTNVDKSTGSFGTFKVGQPDSGIATAGLPASNTSVGRFVRAAFYANYAEKAKTPDRALLTLAHVMNNFDRPRDITIDYPQDGGSHMEVAGLSDPNAQEYATEFTCWTSLTDLERGQFLIRGYDDINFTRLDLTALASVGEPKVLPLAKLSGAAPDATGLLKGVAA